MTDQSNGSVFSEAPQETPAQSQAPQQGQQQAQQETAPQQPAQPAPTASSDNVFADQLASIKNERGEPKYQDLPTALDALRHSQQYIPQLKQELDTLKQENATLKAQLEQHGNLEDTIERLTSQRQEAPSHQEVQGLTPEQVQELLEQQLSQREQQQKAQTNAQQVEQAIVQRYGDKAGEVARQKAQEMGISVTKFAELAAESPQMVLALFDVKPTPQGNPSSSSVSIPPVNPDKGHELERPEKSLLSGASTKDQMDYMRKVKEATYKRLGVTQ